MDSPASPNVSYVNPQPRSNRAISSSNSADKTPGARRCGGIPASRSASRRFSGVICARSVEYQLSRRILVSSSCLPSMTAGDAGDISPGLPRPFASASLRRSIPSRHCSTRVRRLSRRDHDMLTKSWTTGLKFPAMPPAIAPGALDPRMWIVAVCQLTDQSLHRPFRASQPKSAYGAHPPVVVQVGDVDVANGIHRHTVGIRPERLSHLPWNRGSRFSTNARAASRWSAVRPVCR